MKKDEVQYTMPAFALCKGETAAKQIKHNRYQDYTPYNITKTLFIVKNNQAGQQVLINVYNAKYLVALRKCVSEYEEQKTDQQNSIFSLIDI